ncbi:MAG TPA: heat-inducible transcriptional repressor HrcA [Egibacteraceae bacterium]|nr:heat-inducible transcriptional repressor HrcA [Actinomycetota bacterium]HWB72862.1 heat-inducible transcriptional repressor HrcA [Egibacteraceae bacterium]
MRDDSVLDLDERKAAILKAIVQAYIREGEPVGSKRLVEGWSFGVSPATVRSDMAALEEAGFITHPHPSAGRVPTDKGYRFYVDSLPGVATLSPDQRAALEQLLLGSADLEELLRRTSGVLSRLTRFAALVAAPRLDRSRLRHVELVQLGPTSVLAVFIADTGRVEKRMLDLDAPVAEQEIGRARHAVNEAVCGLWLSQARDVISGLGAGAPPEVRGLVEAVAEAVRDGLVGPPSEQVFVGGTANIAGEGYFDRLEQVKQVFETLEEQVVVLKMLRAAVEAGDPAVRIGTELPLVELAACSVVAARYEAGHASGSLGVLGPTRMDYPRTLAAVQAVASSLEKALAELSGGGNAPSGP